MRLSMFLFAVSLIAACAVADTSTSEVATEARCLQQSYILCVEGYHPKTVGCHQICVPDHGAECTTDDECAIYCITTPCPVGRCVGNQCRTFTNAPNDASGSTCKPQCASGYYCSECKTVGGSGFFCLPDGSAC